MSMSITICKVIGGRIHMLNPMFFEIIVRDDSLTWRRANMRELNGLDYAAGYVPRVLHQKKLLNISHPRQKDLLYM